MDIFMMCFMLVLSLRYYTVYTEFLIAQGQQTLGSRGSVVIKHERLKNCVKVYYLDLNSGDNQRWEKMI